jgi:two-component system response regulator FlrC
VILTQDPVLAETLALARRAADSRATILIQAESGTGKELLAKLIHAASPRRKGAFVAINCAAIPENLLESELFGFEKGAFTGATSAKPGRFEQADGGTLVLDEIGELPLSLQGKLLRAIQERTIDRLGGNRPIAVDVRIIALTNRDLVTEVKEGRFREDLYYRLNVIPLRLPPLRERTADLDLLALHFAERYARDNDRPTPKLAPSFQMALTRHPWPGNIRELENAIQRCVVLNPSNLLTEKDLRWLLDPSQLEGLPEDPPELAESARALPDPPMAPEPGHGALIHVADPRLPLQEVPLGTLVALPLGLSLPELERFWLLSTLAALEGNRTHCSQKLDIALRTVRNKINEYRADGFEIPSSGHGRDD